MTRLTKFWARFMDVKRPYVMNRILMKAGRRCSRDLNHAVSAIHCKETRELFEPRIAHWQTIFWDAAQYHDQLYAQIDHLTSKVEKLEKQLEDLGEDPVTKDIPF